jgi:DNA-directed RNA polymerase beta subunit
MHLSSQVEVIKNIIKKLIKENKYNIKELCLCKQIDLKLGIRIFINGEWIGITRDGYNLSEYFKERRRISAIDKTVSIVFNIFDKEIRLNCDGGRMYRPLLNVKNNKIILTEEILNKIELGTDDENKIKNWN